MGVSFMYLRIVLLFILMLCKGSYEEECEVKLGAGHEVNMSIISKRNDNGEWVSTFTAEKESNRNASVIVADATFKALECKGKQKVRIQGVLRETNRKPEDRLVFHPNCGTSIAVVNGGRSIVKLNKNAFNNDVAITKRPLKDNEIFEVRLDEKISKVTYSMGIGVTTHNPKYLDLPAHLSDLKTGTWTFFHGDVFRNGTRQRSDEEKEYTSNIDNLGAGSRLGVKRTEFGTLHLYVNGVDQGPAASRVPEGVYGVYQLHGNAVKATIVDAH